MLRKMLRQTVGFWMRPAVPVDWVQNDETSWLGHYLGSFEKSVRATRFAARIERLSAHTTRLGPQRLWDKYLEIPGYHKNNSTRRPDEVRSHFDVCNLFADLVRVRRPNLVVEFGAAFGVSGMYWLAGLEEASAGRLLSFEANKNWCAIARQNMTQIGTRFKLVEGTFESNIDVELAPGEKIDICFIDAIHTREFVTRQFEIVAARLATQGLVVIDDVDFPGMDGCWEDIAVDPRVRASAILRRHIGIVEFK